MNNQSGRDAVKAAIEAAIEAGVFYQDAMALAVRPAQDEHTPLILVRVEFVSYATAESFRKRQELEARIGPLPRGHYGVMRTVFPDGRESFQAVVSDGSGVYATGGSSDHHGSEPDPVKVANRVLGYECYTLRNELRAEKNKAEHAATIAARGYRAGQKLKSIRVGGTTYSSVIVESVTENQITMICTKRGSRGRWRWNGHAQGIEQAATPAASPLIMGVAA
jgi:hypothetical protein